MPSPKKRGLGKGLGALISGLSDTEALQALEPAPVASDSQILWLNPEQVRPNPKQPRKTFTEESLEELAQSIKRDGMQEPVIVRRVGDSYELVSGERRVRASVMAGVERIPAICREVSDTEMLRLGLIENIQREDLNAIELARAYQQLTDEFRWTQEELAAQVGKKRATVTNTLRLLNLPSYVQDCLANGSISMGHARAILAIPSAEAQTRACRKVIAQGLSVRQTEKLAAPPRPRAATEAVRKDPNLAMLEDELRRRLGTRVTMKPAGQNRGRIEIEYYTLDDLERILDILQVKP
ncbi:MAG: ParB/RepB/Spo0J family partition protein [Candidatus Hydrogenedentes bacterium]|nr:ParB/RepB/Spo0J family partition protein [Candidatus Hydrogenedentota bacterium]